MVNQNVQEALKKLQKKKRKNMEDTKTNILIGALNKHQSETGNTINKEINELRMKIDNIKEEMTHDMENLRKGLNTNTKHNGRPLQKTRTTRRQNLRT
jgi:4-hydroxy-L-threonine phosphate dehydrogenase PdxA